MGDLNCGITRVGQVENTQATSEPGGIDQRAVELFADTDARRNARPARPTQGLARSNKSQAATGSMFSRSVTSMIQMNPCKPPRLVVVFFVDGDGIAAAVDQVLSSGITVWVGSGIASGKA